VHRQQRVGAGGELGADEFGLRDITADGRLVIERAVRAADGGDEATPAVINVYLNWFDELRRILPSDADR